MAGGAWAWLAVASLSFAACVGAEPIVGTVYVSGEAGVVYVYAEAAAPEAAMDAALDTRAEADGAETSVPAVPPSCVGLAKTCGKSKDKDCCASTLVPGGTYNRSNDGAYPATVSAFKLDVFEVTVGRFRAFVNAGKGIAASPPADDDGAHPKIPGSGWNSGFNANLPADTTALRAAVKCDPDYPVWTDAVGVNETLPMNCLNWFEAFAFCAWDGGRLPTEAEWNFAAANGSEERDYPWGSGIDSTKACYGCACDGSPAGACAFTDIRPVGSYSPQGDGKWGHADLAGNVWEWSLDWKAIPYPATICNDCANLASGTDRVVRGGSVSDAASTLLASSRYGGTPTIRSHDVGARCLRTALP